MKIDIQRFIDNTCMECEKYNRGKFGKCQAEKEDIYIDVLGERCLNLKQNQK